MEHAFLAAAARSGTTCSVRKQYFKMLSLLSGNKTMKSINSELEGEETIS